MLTQEIATAKETVLLPDREPKFWERGYVPAREAIVHVNPPVFGWVHEAEADFYELQWSLNPDFKEATRISRLHWSTYAHHEPLPPGHYFWRYRIKTRAGETSPWSLTREFEVPQGVALCPQPTHRELCQRLPRTHPRLFVNPETLTQLRAETHGAKAQPFSRLLCEADRLLQAEPTPEPPVAASLDDGETRQYWWHNRLQTLKACHEAELLSFVFLLTENPVYGQAARRSILALAAWNPEGATNWALNDEAAMPMLHRLARAYDWAYDCLSKEDRRLILRVLRQRGLEAWRHYQFDNGTGHLSAPYNSHANRAWHILGECAIATMGEIPEAELWLDYAVTKFYTAYPMWTDEEGGWHEGLSYWAAYLSKFVWWAEVAETALGIKCCEKPFFSRFADYALYTAPPSSPNVGFGDESAATPNDDWWFVHYFARRMRNPYWAWWAKEWKITSEPQEPVLRFLLGAGLAPEPQPPIGLNPSKVFEGTGVAVLNTTLCDALENVQLRFKSSAFGRRSHGHDPQNSFTLNAYGTDLLVNNVYRDYHGSPFHSGWCWSTRAHNALLVNGEGQIPHSSEARGRILAWDFQPGVDYLAGDATEAYAGNLLRRYVRHVLFVKPNIIVLADEIEAYAPSTFQLMLHAHAPFDLDEQRQQLSLKREAAGVQIHYHAPERLRLRQWEGYEPVPDSRYLSSVNRNDFPTQWHVEASTESLRRRTLALTVLLPHRAGDLPCSLLHIEETDSSLLLHLLTAKNRAVNVTLYKSRLGAFPTAGEAAGLIARVRVEDRDLCVRG